jgi:RNA polymerase-binding transcription factor DksA
MDKRQAKKLLQAERTRLQALLETFEIDSTTAEPQGEAMGEVSMQDQHPADVGTETFEREKDYSIRQQIEAELADIERATKRLANGSFGLCEACGRKIGEERLKTIPWTRYCVKDQARLEREASHARIA